jgi:hypothetical protein
LLIGTGGCGAAAPVESNGRKGAGKLDRTSPVGCHKQIGLIDYINHHHLMNRLRHGIADRWMVGLIGLFPKAGVLSENQFPRTEFDM